MSEYKTELVLPHGDEIKSNIYDGVTYYLDRDHIIEHLSLPIDHPDYASFHKQKINEVAVLNISHNLFKESEKFTYKQLGLEVKIHSNPNMIYLQINERITHITRDEYSTKDAYYNAAKLIWDELNSKLDEEIFDTEAH